MLNSIYRLARSDDVCIVGIGRVFIGAEIANTHVLCVISVGMTACKNQSVCRIVGAGKGTVRQHIAVKVITYGVAVEHDTDKMKKCTGKPSVGLSKVPLIS